MKNITFIGKYKTVLLLTDDEVCVYKGVGGGVELAGVIAWDENQFIDKTLAVIQNKCGNKPLVVLNDMSEQFYKVDKIPIIRNPLDRKSMVKRKLSAAFPQYKITGALIQSDKLKGQKESNHRAVLAAIPSSQKIQRINNVLNYSGLQILNFGLLPVESASLVNALSSALNKSPDRSKSRWTVFIAQNSSGGLRQIVIKNGQMALTRMTPLVNTDDDPETWASEVSQELKATMTYLTRFDYKQDDNLDVVVICNTSAGQILEGLIETSCNFYSLTVMQAADKVGISLVDPENTKFIDPLHVRWAANKSSFAMDMKAKDVANISQARMGAIAASIALFFSLIYFTGAAYETYSGLSKAKQDIVTARVERTQAKQNLIEAENNSDVTDYDVNLVRGAVEASKKYSDKGIMPIDYIKRINKAMRKDRFTFNSLQMSFEGSASSSDQRGSRSRRGSDEEKSDGTVLIKLQLLFPGDIAPEKGNSQVEKISRNIQAEFDDIGFEVKVSKFLRDMSFESQFSGSAGLSAKSQGESSTFNAQIEIAGDAS